MEKRFDKRGRLEEGMFFYQITKDKKVFISWRGRRVAILSGGKAENFIAGVENATELDAQLIMAKATGNFKRGNEKGRSK